MHEKLVFAHDAASIRVVLATAAQNCVQRRSRPAEGTAQKWSLPRSTPQLPRHRLPIQLQHCQASPDDHRAGVDMAASVDMHGRGVLPSHTSLPPAMSAYARPDDPRLQPPPQPCQHMLDPTILVYNVRSPTLQS